MSFELGWWVAQLPLQARWTNSAQQRPVGDTSQRTPEKVLVAPQKRVGEPQVARRSVPRASRPGFDLQKKVGDLLVDLSALLHLAGDLLDRMDNSGVIAPAKDPGDGRVAVVR